MYTVDSNCFLSYFCRHNVACVIKVCFIYFVVAATINHRKIFNITLVFVPKRNT